MLPNLIRILRVISLTVLSGGSVGVVIAALASIKSSQANQIPIAQAASANVPVFINYGKAALVAAIFLLFLELLDYLVNQKVDFPRLLRYGSSFSCFLAALIFYAVLVPKMSLLLPSILDKQKAAQSAIDLFQQLHNQSRLAVAGIIIFSLISIAVPIADEIYKLRKEEATEEDPST
jgi:hypothetical protein